MDIKPCEPACGVGAGNGSEFIATCGNAAAGQPGLRFSILVSVGRWDREL